MPKVLEFDLQRAFVLWLDGYPRDGVPTKPLPLIPGVEYWHTPNGGTRRDAFEGKRMNQIGLKAGIPDLWFLWGALYGLEWKQPGGSLNNAQKDLHPRLIHAGARIATVDNLAAGKAQLATWGLLRLSCVDSQHMA